jgi:hypothetical protein
MTYAEKYDELRSKGYRAYEAAVAANAYARESTDRTERRSCGDPGELAAQERWLRRRSA